MDKYLKKDYYRRSIIIKNFIKLQIYKSFLKNPKLSIEERQLNFLKKRKIINLNINQSKIRNHCLYTNSTRSIYKYTKLSRHIFKDMVLNGQLPGCI